VIGNLVRKLTGADKRAALPAQSMDWDDWLGVRSPAGVTVTPDAALGVTTVMSCVTLIARSLASVPLVLYRREGETGRHPAVSHPLYPILHDLANPLLTAFDVRQTLFAAVLLYGNAYAEIEWGSDGYPAALWPLPPDGVELWVTPDQRTIFYKVREDNGHIKTLAPYQVHHLRGLMTQGLLGISPLRAANAIGLAMATEQFGSKFFGQGAHPSIVLSHPGKLTPEAVKNLRASFEQQWAGLGNAQRVAVVGEGVKPEPMRIPPNEAQMLETRAFQVQEICRIFNVSPGLVGAAETQTYASAEQDMLRFRELTLGPWAEAEEKCIHRDLLTPEEQRTYFAQHKLSKLQATDLKTRYESHQIAVLSGLETPNERRQLEDMNPIAGGDDLWMPLNMALASQVAKQAVEAPASAAIEDDQADDSPDSSTDNTAAEELARAWVADVQRRLLARIENDVRQQGAKTLRNGGRLGLSEWGETQQMDWRRAGEEMLAPVLAAGPAPAADVAAWVAGAYQASVKGLIDGN
jgi:HK97 family phage portal protein